MKHNKTVYVRLSIQNKQAHVSIEKGKQTTQKSSVFLYIHLILETERCHYGILPTLLTRQATEDLGESRPVRDPGHKMDAVLTGMGTHGIHQWSRDNDWFFQYFSVLATTEVLTERWILYC